MKIPHLVYGTFPDRPGSQHVIYKSPEISAELETWLIHFYNNFGDCKNEDFKSSLTVFWYEDQQGQRLATITRVSHQGRDFSGRWGALLRHTAVLSVEQFREFLFDPFSIGALLVSSGTSEELSQIGEIELEAQRSSEEFLTGIALRNLEIYRQNLQSIFKGDRLVLYSEKNNDLTNASLNALISLLPFSVKKRLNWSEFIFRSLENLDISLVHSSRYEEPSADPLHFTVSGKNCLSDLPEEFAGEYLSALTAAIAAEDLPQLQILMMQES